MAVAAAAATAEKHSEEHEQHKKASLFKQIRAVQKGARESAGFAPRVPRRVTLRPASVEEVQELEHVQRQRVHLFLSSGRRQKKQSRSVVSLSDEQQQKKETEKKKGAGVEQEDDEERDTEEEETEEGTDEETKKEKETKTKTATSRGASVCEEERADQTTERRATGQPSPMDELSDDPHEQEDSTRLLHWSEGETVCSQNSASPLGDVPAHSATSTRVIPPPVTPPPRQTSTAHSLATPLSGSSSSSSSSSLKTSLKNSLKNSSSPDTLLEKSSTANGRRSASPGGGRVYQQWVPQEICRLQQLIAQYPNAANQVWQFANAVCSEFPGRTPNSVRSRALLECRKNDRAKDRLTGFDSSQSSSSSSSSSSSPSTAL